jgi:Domain of unknown function (DUF4123)
MTATEPIAVPLDKLKELLFAVEDESVYAVLDGASVPGLLPKLRAAKEDWACLYRGELEPDLAEVAPYLVKLRRDSPLTDWILEAGWGNHWGIFAVTKAGLEALRRHFRYFLRVKDYTGQTLYFRFYDPRVLRIYLPTCRRNEIAMVYGPISKFITEDEKSGQALVLGHDPLRIRPQPWKFNSD